MEESAPFSKPVVCAELNGNTAFCRHHRDEKDVSVKGVIQSSFRAYPDVTQFENV